jgi:hypothetical protein
MQLKVQSKIEALRGKTVMHNTKIFKIIDFVEINEQVILSTDSRTIVLRAAQVEQFVQECLPVEVESKNEVQPVLPTTIFTEITSGLMKQFQEIQASEGEEELKLHGKKAKHLIGISRAVTDIAQVIITSKKYAEK